MLNAIHASKATMRSERRRVECGEAECVDASDACGIVDDSNVEGVR